jgi:hypothetical protein
LNDWAEIERFIMSDGKVTPEALVWLRALVAYVKALEARIAVLE